MAFDNRDGVNGRMRRRVAQKGAATLPATTTQDLFTVTGQVRILHLHGLVTTAIQAQANNAKIIFHPTTGSDVDLCAVADITGLAVNTRLGITGTLATALQKGLAIVGQSIPIELGPGTIRLSCSATNTGGTSWACDFESGTGGNVVPA